ncbi:hypothetical protein DFP73DRAFT_487499 [Morchella snyderi]|nr:hypothetical protein DFP73DRAFT_487499 [Morchella snyderi]
MYTSNSREGNRDGNASAGPNSQQHFRPGSGRRSMSVSQPLSGQLPTSSNGNSAAAPAGPTPVPLQQQQQPHGQPPGIPIGPNMPPFDASRSPPSNKNLNHVPCKFFRQGACQAGKACPFSHNLDPSTDQAPCKYFSKGNCKFGIKCALAHILPDGRKINRPSFNNGGGHGQIQFSRMDTSHTNHRSALHNSLLQANMIPHHTPNHNFNGGDDFNGISSNQSNNGDNMSSSLPGDSPLDNISTSQRTLGPLDATLPASFERHDFSLFARTGPYASSVPSKFGMESPPPSLSNGRNGVLASLYISAFGDEESSIGGGLSRSPRVNGEDSLGQRIMHSSMSSRRQKLLPASYARAENMERMLGERFRKDNGSDADFAFEEDFVPSSLNELLTPAERSRRLSRTDEEGVSSFRHSLTAPATPADPGVIGSPPVGSPSGGGGWGPIVMRTKRDDHEAPAPSIGHVGSPLRNSYHHGDSSPTFRSLALGRETSPYPGSPTRGSFGGISTLTQTMQRARLSSTRSDPYDLPTVSKSLGPTGKQMERAMSSSHSSNKGVASIDEEPETQFLMEDEDETSSSRPIMIGGTGRSSGLGLEVSQQQWEGFGPRR